MTLFFSLQELQLRVECSGVVADSVVPILDYHGFQPATSTDGGESDESWTVDISVVSRVDRVPAGGQAAGDHESGLTIYRFADRTILHGDRARAEMSASGRTLTVQLTKSVAAKREDLSPTLYFILTFSLLALLQRQSLYAIHGAAVCQGEDNGVLFVGYSDTGKSTMTMALVRRGWQYLSDDSIFIRQDGDIVEALPFRRDFGLDPDSDQYFPELIGHGDTQMTDVEKWRVDVKQLYPALARERCIPRAIIFPKIADVPTSTLAPIGQAEALVLLMRQCSFIDTDKDLASAQMSTLQSLVRQSSLHKLEAGLDLKEDPGRVEDLLHSLIES